jgi:hypothetical protein
MPITVNDFHVDSIEVKNGYGRQYLLVTGTAKVNGELYPTVYTREEPCGRVSISECQIPEVTTENTLHPDFFEEELEDFLMDR